jgi:hypothetical protein
MFSCIANKCFHLTDMHQLCVTVHKDATTICQTSVILMTFSQECAHTVFKGETLLH